MRKALCAIALLAACQSQIAGDREARLEHARYSPATAFVELEALHREAGLPISHWPDSALADSLTRAGVEGPCGPDQHLWVKRLTPVASRHSLDRVIEFDDHRVIRSWDFPANEQPHGIRGDALLHVPIWFPESLKLDSASLPVVAVRPDGSLRVERLGAALREPIIECPRFADQKTSGFWMCREFVDQVSGAKRRLGYNAVCT